MSTTMSFPPRLDSVGARSVANPLDSPLPALPTLPSKLETKPMPSIPRKAVASPTAQAVQPGITPLRLKRNSSISSLLSAYSHTSSDSVPRSSQGSSITKGSEHSLSPERDAINDEGNEFTRGFDAYSRNPYEEPLIHEKGWADDEALPPPPPLKDVNTSRPTTPRTGLPATPRPGGSPPVRDTAATSSPVSVTNGSPPRREIWRRRASSKSDGSLAFADLKLAVSHGSTAATTAPLPIHAHDNVDVNNTSSLTAKLGGTLPGRNVRPQISNPHDNTTKKLAQGSKSLSRRSSGEALGIEKSVDVAGPPSLPAKDPSNADRSTRIVQAPSTDKTNKSPTTVSPLSSPEPRPRSGNSFSGRPVADLAQPWHQQSSSSPGGQAMSSSLRGADDVMHQSSGGSPLSPNGPHASPRAYTAHEPPQPASMHVAHQHEPRMAYHPANPEVTLTPPPNSNLSTISKEDEDAVANTAPLTQEDQGTLAEALNLFPREYNFIPTKDGVWPSLPLAIHHYRCMSDHRRWISMRNHHSYPIKCMVCHAAEKTQLQRAVCASCQVRVCLSCREMLRGGKLQDVDLDSLRQGKSVVSPVS
ncbi:hypothetical protein BJ170DRAFT_682732 [Xylariales sp. AK1849]|nr:hypothetical protein BJ170DRAFT_682732 [Xylariales sp. AK1849]